MPEDELRALIRDVVVEVLTNAAESAAPKEPTDDAIAEETPAEVAALTPDADVMVDELAVDEPSIEELLSVGMPDEDEDEEPAPVKAQRPGILASIKAALNDAVRGNADVETNGFKAYGDHWVAWWTNNFKDRDGEIFTAKSIDDYIARVDTGIVPMPELWTWHTPGSAHGKADMLGRIGNFCIAVGSFDNTPAGNAAKAHYARHSKSYALSHGFMFDPEHKRDGVYHQFNTFEISTLPPKVAANPYTLFDDKDKTMLTPEKMNHLKTLFGEAVANEIISDTEAKSKAIAELGVAYKDFVDVATAVADAPASDNKALTDMVAELVLDNAEAVKMVSAVGKANKAHEAATADKLAAFEARIKQQDAQIAALQETVDGAPRRGSQENVVQKSDLAAQLQKQLDEDNLEPLFPGSAIKLRKS